MARLIAKSGFPKDSSWPIGEQPLVIGRESACDIQIPDPVVSRKHCEICLERNAIRLRDLGGVNPTYVNGLAVTTCTLNVGDEIRVGRTAFLVAEDSRGDDEAPPAAIDAISTVTLMESESRYLAEVQAETAEIQPGAAMDFAGLFHLSRSLGRSTSIDELTKGLGAALEKRFSPQHAWLMLLEGKEEHTTRLCGRGIAPPPPMDLIHQALEERTGGLTVRRQGAGKPGQIESVLTAPIFMGSHNIGSLALWNGLPSSHYTRDDLDFLVAIAHVVAPLVKAVERVEELELENKRLRAAEQTLSRMIGDTPEMDRVREVVRMVAPSDQSVLILGETGTGKEMVATQIHRLSERAQGLLVTVNCAAIPRELFESEFFGYEKGAFTGAIRRKTGLFEQSHGGTLFLDEIGDLSSDNQARILRAIETKTFRRVGGDEDIHVDFRVVAATNKDLTDALEEGLFREDLYHRLKGVEVRVPALRDRRSDIPALAEFFLEAFCTAKKLHPRRFSPEAIDYLMNHSWPGNVRELKNCIETAVTLSQGDVIDREDLVAIGISAGPARAPLPLADMERQHILAALEYCNGRVVEAADLLGIGKSKLYTRLAEYGMPRRK